MESAVEKYIEFLQNSETDKVNIFESTKKVSLQVVLHKILNLKNEKEILCNLPHPINNPGTTDVCLIVKDLDKKSRDYETTMRKYDEILSSKKLNSMIKQVLPMKQLKLEFRPFEAKKKLCSTFDLFLAEKGLHDLLFRGSRLGKEFRKKKRMPIAVDLEQPNIDEKIKEIILSTSIHLQGKGPAFEVAAFTTDHTVKQAIENIKCIRSKLNEVLPGGEKLIKSISLKATDAVSVPIYMNLEGANDVKIPNNIKSKEKKTSKRMQKAIKRLNSKKAATKVVE